MKGTMKLLVAALAVSALLTAAALAASSPSVTTRRASSISSSSATLNGTLNPNGKRARFVFDLGLTKSYGITVVSRRSVGGSKPVAVKATVHRLLPGTVYHYRLAATNSAGSSVGSDRTFRTTGNPPPAAATGPATNVGRDVATVTGVINPHNEQTSYKFQYGISVNYNVETVPRTVPAGDKPVNVAVALTGLAPGTNYHYRLLALHGSSVVQYGADASFFTQPLRPRRPAVKAHTTPHHARSAPYQLTTAGRVLGPRSIPKSASCFGNAVVKFLLGRRRVATTVLAITPNCTFSGRTVFKRLPRRRGHTGSVRLKVRVHFRGNGYLAAASAAAEHVVLG